jgi:hypothetical protein
MGTKIGMVKIFFILLLSRIAIFLLPILIWQISNKSGVNWVWWDAPHFVYIAQHGYTNIGDPANYIVFPPLYPLLIKIVSKILTNFNLSAIIISMISFSAAGVLFYKIVGNIWGKEIAKKALFLLAIFPTSYFFAAPYTESTFWFLAMFCILMTSQKRYFLAGVFAGMTLLSRLPGLVLLIVPIVTIFQHKSRKINFIIFLTPVILCILAYLFINWQLFSDPFAFRDILQNHWQKTFAWPWESIKSSWLATKGGLSDEYALQVGYWEAIPATLSLMFIPFVWKYLKNTAWSSWYTLSVILITSTSFLLSTPRYLLAIPPLFVFLAIIGKKYPLIYFSWIFVSSALLAYFSMRFVTGEWSF